MTDGRKPRYWMGSAPTKCDLCDEPLGKDFVDGQTRTGQWGILCPQCHHDEGRGLGVGRGQQYLRTPEDKWLKVDG